MRVFSRIGVGLYCVWALLVPAQAAGTLVFTTIDVPGATVTNVQGINHHGDIVGGFVDGGGQQHGFLRSGGRYRVIDYPNGHAILARGINDAGDIVGTYQRPGETGGVPAHGFLLTRRGGLLAVDYPGHLNTIPQRILNDGTILGCYHDTNTMDTMHGMITSRKGVSAFDMGMTMHNGATPDGKRIAGFWSDSTNHGYLLQGEDFMSFDVPGSASTAAWDMNPQREIVGVYTGADKKVHGFLVDADWQFTTIDVSGATITRALGINSGGDVVGAYVAGGITHGYIAHRLED